MLAVDGATGERGAGQRVARGAVGGFERRIDIVVGLTLRLEHRFRDAAHLDAHGETRQLAGGAIGGSPSLVPRVVGDGVQRGRPRGVTDRLPVGVELLAYAWIARALDH